MSRPERGGPDGRGRLEALPILDGPAAEALAEPPARVGAFTAGAIAVPLRTIMALSHDAQHGSRTRAVIAALIGFDLCISGVPLPIKLRVDV